MNDQPITGEERRCARCGVVLSAPIQSRAGYCSPECVAAATGLKETWQFGMRIPIAEDIVAEPDRTQMTTREIIDAIVAVTAARPKCYGEDDLDKACQAALVKLVGALPTPKTKG